MQKDHLLISSSVFVDPDHGLMLLDKNLYASTVEGVCEAWEKDKLVLVFNDDPLSEEEELVCREYE